MRDLRLLAPPVSTRIPSLGLLALYGFTGFALVGYATFGLHPSLLAHMPRVAGFYGVSFPFFAQAHVWGAWATFTAFLLVHAGRRWVPAFVVLYAISLGSELLGTGVGIPFGDYRYTAALGPGWLGLVPVVIPLSWFFMAVSAYAISRSVLPDRPLARVSLASIVLVCWDLALDPAMSRATAYWVWAESGTYYGMPWLNLFGWYVTGLGLMTALATLRADRWIARLPLSWVLGFYAVNLLLPLGMCAAAGLWGAVVVTLVAFAGTALLGMWVARPHPSGQRIGEATP